jgi:hypothetical protein
MTDRTPEDPTRDIRLPPLPDRPAPALPAEWAGARAAPGHVEGASTAVPGSVGPAAGRPEDAAAAGQPVEAGAVGEEAPAAPGPEVDPERAEALRLAGRRTDELQPPPGSVARERTLAFSSPEMRHRSIEPVRVEARPRRWPWVVLALLPIVVIVASAVAWVILLRGT